MPTTDTHESRRSDEEYLEYEPFRGDRDVDVQCRTVKMVTVRKPHPCMVGVLLNPQREHDIEPGTRAVCESAKVDGEFGSCYYCLDCLETFMRFDENNGEWEDSVGADTD